MRCPSLALGLALFASLALACTGSDGSEDGDETGAASSATTGEAPPPGPGAEGWQSAYADGGVAFACDADEQSLIDAGVPALSFGDASIYVGYEQNGNNQNPLFARYDGGTQLYCQRHESEPPDARALGLSWDGGDYAYVVYTVDGGGSSLEGKGGWLSAYAPGAISGGGPKVSVLGRASTSDGALETASFIISVKSDNKVNSHSPRAAPTVLEDGNIEFLGESAHKPIDADGKNSMDCTDYPFSSRYVLTPELDSLVCASCSNCVAQQPCE